MFCFKKNKKNKDENKAVNEINNEKFSNNGGMIYNYDFREFRLLAKKLATIKHMQQLAIFNQVQKVVINPEREILSTAYNKLFPMLVSSFEKLSLEVQNYIEVKCGSIELETLDKVDKNSIICDEYVEFCLVEQLVYKFNKNNNLI